MPSTGKHPIITDSAHQDITAMFDAAPEKVRDLAQHALALAREHLWGDHDPISKGIEAKITSLIAVVDED